MVLLTSPWFKLYAGVTLDPDLTSMPLAQQAIYFRLLAHSSQQEERGSVSLKDFSSLAKYVANGDTKTLKTTIEYLRDGWGCITITDHILYFKSWGKYQTPASQEPSAVRERVHRWRERRKSDEDNRTPDDVMVDLVVDIIPEIRHLPQQLAALRPLILAAQNPICRAREMRRYWEVERKRSITNFVRAFAQTPDLAAPLGESPCPPITLPPSPSRTFNDMIGWLAEAHLTHSLGRALVFPEAFEVEFLGLEDQYMRLGINDAALTPRLQSAFEQAAKAVKADITIIFESGEAA